MQDLDVLVFASQKGGSGKTTLSGHMAVAALRADYGPVAIIDTDPQGSLLAWAKARGQSFLSVTKHSGEPLGEEIAKLKEQGARLIVIDTPPAANTDIVEAIRVASLVVVPTRPSPHDLRAVAGTVDMAERAQCGMIFVLNAANLQAKITSDAAVALSQHGTVAPVFIQQRVEFASSMIDRRTTCELVPEGRSAKEIALLWEYVASQLDKRERRRVFQQPHPPLPFGRRASL